MIPILFTVYNRLEYTKQALESLMKIEGIEPFIFDNYSTDGTREWLKGLRFVSRRPRIIYSTSNLGISGAMNFFLSMTENHDIVGKIDSDTICEPSWCKDMLPYLKHCDMIQSRHHIIPATCPGGWNEFVKPMRFQHGIYYNHFIGGSGVLFKRKQVQSIPITKHKLMGWREFQRMHPNLSKGFVNSVSIRLLDEHGYTDYPDYYKETGRL